MRSAEPSIDQGKRGADPPRIRTYSYGAGAVKDHRINLTVQELEKILAGGLHDLTAALQDDERRRQQD